MPLRVLYEDNHLLGVYKPAGMLVQGDRTGDPTLFEAAKAYLKVKYDKPGNVYLGLVHRIDRPVSGVVVFARTSKAASRLTNAFRAREVDKLYLAVIRGVPGDLAGELHGHVERVRMRSRITGPGGDAKPATLSYRDLASDGGMSLPEVTPQTGRHHQIRVQLAHAGYPIVGDLKYGAPGPLPDRSIALHAAMLALDHPTRDGRVRLQARPPDVAPWIRFAATIEGRFQGDA